MMDQNTDKINLNRKPIYKRVDCVDGLLTDETMIELYKISQQNDVSLNYLLGKFNGIGEYEMDGEIINSLITMKKMVINAFAGSLFLESVAHFDVNGRLKFSLTFVKLENNRQKAILKVLEPINRVNGYIINTNSYVVQTYIDEDNDDFKDKAFKYFHIYETAEDCGKEDPETVKAILMRLLFLKNFNQMMSHGLSDFEKEYYESRVKLLSDCAFEDFFKEFDRLKNQSGVFFSENDKSKYLYLNQLFDMALDNVLYDNRTLGDKILEELKGKIVEFSDKMELLTAKCNESTLNLINKLKKGVRKENSNQNTQDLGQ